MRKLLAILGTLAGATLVVGVIVLGAWAVGGRVKGDLVAPRVVLAGHPVGNDTPAQLDAVIETIERSYDKTPIAIEKSDVGPKFDSSSIHLAVDAAKTRAEVLAIGRRGSVGSKSIRWARSWVATPNASVKVSYDKAALVAALAASEPEPRNPPVEPSLTAKAGVVTATSGKNGVGYSPIAAAEALPVAATRGLPLRLSVARVTLAPRFGNAEAETLAAKINQRLAPIEIQAKDKSAVIPVTTLATWLDTDVSGPSLRLGVSSDLALKGLSDAVGSVGTKTVDGYFVVNDDKPSFVEGVAGEACCDPSAVSLIQSALRSRLDALEGAHVDAMPVVLPLRIDPPKTTALDIAKFGIKEQVSTFTTQHPANQPRVTNIHLIADLVRGHVIEPGQTFSLNDFVGERTAAKGFVVDHVIEDSKFSEAVGGGISQFATTLFNAAFFAGMDYGEYQSHSIYIDRYPYGREATISFPHPDLQIKNTTPFGILIWPTYTGTSLTVSMYSTHYVDATQTNQTKGPSGACTSVHTERTRNYVDGKVVVDSVRALYQPAEGVKC